MRQVGEGDQSLNLQGPIRGEVFEDARHKFAKVAPLRFEANPARQIGEKGQHGIRGGEKRRGTQGMRAYRHKKETITMKDTRKFSGKTYRLKHEVTRQQMGWALREIQKLRDRGYCVRKVIGRTRLTGITDVGIYVRKKRGGKC